MNNTGSILFCVQCGTPVRQEEKFGRLRPVCPACGWIYFADPKVAVAVVVLEGDRVLLTRRMNPPFQGYWSLPAGFMDAGEDPQSAARRECLEETGLEIQIIRFLNVITGREHEHGADLILVYEGKSHGGKLQAGDDADQAVFFSVNSLPPLAFSSTQAMIDTAINRNPGYK
jgi:8-oxo-dGTP diphosphatase